MVSVNWKSISISDDTFAESANKTKEITVSTIESDNRSAVDLANSWTTTTPCCNIVHNQ